MRASCGWGILHHRPPGQQCFLFGNCDELVDGFCYKTFYYETFSGINGTYDEIYGGFCCNLCVLGGFRDGAYTDGSGIHGIYDELSCIRFGKRIVNCSDVGCSHVGICGIYDEPSCVCFDPSSGRRGGTGVHVPDCAHFGLHFGKHFDMRVGFGTLFDLCVAPGFRSQVYGPTRCHDRRLV